MTSLTILASILGIFIFIVIVQIFLFKKLKSIQMTQAELATLLGTLKATLDKDTTKITNAIASAGTVSAELAQAATDLGTSVTAVDAIVPDPAP